MGPIISEVKSRLKGGREEVGQRIFFRTGLRVDVHVGWCTLQEKVPSGSGNA